MSEVTLETIFVGVVKAACRYALKPHTRHMRELCERIEEGARDLARLEGQDELKRVGGWDRPVGMTVKLLQQDLDNISGIDIHTFAIEVTKKLPEGWKKLCR